MYGFLLTISIKKGQVFVFIFSFISAKCSRQPSHTIQDNLLELKQNMEYMYKVT
jgi:hypothetical protein